MRYQVEMSEEIEDNFIISENKSSPESEFFDQVIGQIEEIVMEEEFQTLQRNFLENNWEKVQDTEENTFEYMNVFDEYGRKIEFYLVEKLRTKIPNFDMEKFAVELNTNGTILDGDIFDLLLSLMDFVKFKELILDYRAEKEGIVQNDLLNLGITIKRLTSNVSSEHK